MQSSSEVAVVVVKIEVVQMVVVVVVVAVVAWSGLEGSWRWLCNHDGVEGR